MKACEVLKMDAWVKEGPPAKNQRRQEARELEERSNKRKKPQKVACMRGNKCWAITRNKYCPYSHAEEAPARDKKLKYEKYKEDESE